MRPGIRHSFSLAVLTASLLLASGEATPAAAERLNIRFDRLSVDEGLAQLDVHAILQDRQGFIWIATQDGLNRFDGHEFKTWRHQPNDLSSLTCTPTGDKRLAN